MTIADRIGSCFWFCLWSVALVLFLAACAIAWAPVKGYLWIRDHFTPSEDIKCSSK